MAAKPRVVCFSPVGIAACFDALYRFALDRAPDAPPPGLSAEELRHNGLASRLGDAVVAVAGTGADRAALQAVLDRGRVGAAIPDVAPDALVGVSAVEYSFAWPAAMRAPEGTGVFRLYGPAPHDAFLARVFPERAASDALVVYVHRGPDCDVSVAAVGMPDVLPTAVRAARTPDELRRALGDLHATIAARPPAADPPPLGTATMFDVDATSAFALPEFAGRALPGGRRVDRALHACRLFMNSAGGGVCAGTLMISKGLPADDRTPEDLDLTAFSNGYLVLVELTRPGAPDTSPAVLAMAWVNVPAGVPAECLC